MKRTSLQNWEKKNFLLVLINVKDSAKTNQSRTHSPATEYISSQLLQLRRRNATLESLYHKGSNFRGFLLLADHSLSTPAASTRGKPPQRDPMGGSVKEVRSKQELDAAVGGGAPAALHFWAPWCDASKHMDQVFAQLSTDFPLAEFLRVRTGYPLAEWVIAVCFSNSLGLRCGRMGADCLCLDRTHFASLITRQDL